MNHQSSKTQIPALLSIVLVASSVLMGTVDLAADSIKTTKRTVTKVAEGVYVIRHPDAPDAFPQGNTTVIIGDREVMVVDACYLPSSAKEDIEQIRQWTKKPIRYLLNTHWHYDHTMGNGVYAGLFPDITIIAHTETRRQMEGYNPGWFERFPTRAARFREILESGKDANGKPLTEGEKKEYAGAADGVAKVQEEFRTLVDRIPNHTFELEMTLDLGNRVVQIRHLGRGNTAGDAIVYLPNERILVAGDLLDHPVPYLGGGYPLDLVQTLRTMATIEAETIVPGHGDVLRGDSARAYLNLVIDFIDTVTKQVSHEIYRVGNGSRNLEIVREAVLRAIDMSVWKKRFAGDDADNGDFFDGFSLPGLVTAAYAQLWGR